MTLKEQRFRLLTVATQLAAAHITKGSYTSPAAVVSQAATLISAVTKKLPKE